MVRGFIHFIRTQGVVGLAIGFVLGASVQKVVSAFVADLINPLVGLLLADSGDLASATITIHNAQFLWGDFVATTLDFVIIAAVVYFGFKALRLDRLDDTKE